MVKIKKAKDIDFKYNTKMYWSFIKRYKALAWLLLAVMIINAVTFIADKFILKDVIDKAESFSDGILTTEALVSSLVALALIYASVMMVRTVSAWLVVHFINRLESNSITDLKRYFFSHILHLSYNFHTTHKTGSLISRLGRGSSAVERLTDFIVFNAMSLVLQLVLVSGALFYFNRIASVTVIATVAAFVGYSIYVQNLQRKASIEYNNAEDIEKANVGDFLTNIDSIKYYGKENEIKRRHERLSETTRLKSIRHGDYYKWFDTGHSIILGTGTFFILFFPLIGLINGTTSIGTLIFIYTAFGNLMGPLYGFVYGIRSFYHSMADFESLFQYNRLESEIKDKRNAEDLKITKGEVEFRNVDFSYGKRKILKSFNLKIKENEKVAIVGHSGSGKTTLIKLLYRLYDVNKGSIRIDGKDIRDVKQESLRRELSIVPQECVLFDDTIYNNIAFSNPRASREDVMAAIKFAQLDRIIGKFPKKERTIVGERGVKLSGGEKQRVSIARAILADKKILVLDEATSSLDSKTEHEIHKDLQKLMEGRTSIMIAHRLSTIMSADRIIVMDQGRIVQSGKHADLIKRKGPYGELWDLQKGGYIE